MGREGVAVFLALKILHDNCVVGDRFDIIRVDRNFSTPSGRINDELGDGIATGMAAQGANQLNALARVGPQVSAAGNEIALIEVVGAYAHHQQAMDQ